ncbi:hypothetical protein Taro_013694 [Colocasia esculenta]|uniref:Uncharacterized protein n=1 Tax=Colocasia esculenta TaxID=4460 RepID=A0A843UCF2_COLES|nr:hypothetical protein [Colocasia esculenta]
MSQKARDVPESQELAGMSEKARKWQECPRKPENGQEMARMSKQTKKWQKHLEKSINDENT